MADGTPLGIPARALALSAHPDDAEIRAGATLARWAAQGCEITIAVCTDGSKGSWNGGDDRHELVRTRQAEQQDAARVLGATGTCVFLDQVDGELESGLHQRALVAEVIRRVRPDVVLTHDPWKRYRLHPDHRHAGFLGVEGIVAARDPLFFPEQLTPPSDLGIWRPGALLLWEADEPDHLEPADEASITRKIDALLAHRSQFLSTFGLDQPDTAMLDTFRRRIHDATKGGERFKLLTDL
jgi:LmbE family N-acetylglucosaminyl deacetylase